LPSKKSSRTIPRPSVAPAEGVLSIVVAAAADVSVAYAVVSAAAAAVVVIGLQ